MHAENNKLVFDLGMHHALDTEFYLKKGFEVVSLEANPRLAQAGREKLASFISSGQLTIVEKALWSTDREKVSFFVNPVKDDWSSVSEAWARKGNHNVEQIEVETVSLDQLYGIRGVPRYVKCDIEGADREFLLQLHARQEKPKFVSIEPSGADDIGRLALSGYTQFQLVNQALSHFVPMPSPPREGSFHEVRFNGHMSGLFGLELDEDKWIGAEEATHRLALFRHLKGLDPKLAHGWLDVHARL